MDVETARAALADLPDGTSHGDRALLNQVYVPPSHLKALHPDNLLVTGMRGRARPSGGARSRTKRCAPW